MVTGNNIGEGGSYSGEYTPIITNKVNVTVPAVYSFSFSVNNGNVTLQGKVDFDVITTAILTSFEISLPVATNFVINADGSGSMVSNRETLRAEAVTTNNTIKIFGFPAEVSLSGGNILISYRIK